MRCLRHRHLALKRNNLPRELFNCCDTCVSPNRVTIELSSLGAEYMTEITLDESKLKEILKSAIIELIQEQKEVFSDLLAEVIEDIALEKAIKEGENTEPVSREAIFNIMECKG